MDAEGCPMPDQCMWKHVGVNGEDCPQFCPAFCLPKEMFCPGHWDENGCQVSPDMCMPSQNDDNHCQLHCPVQCAANATFCPGSIDKQGCEMPGHCVSHHVGAHGEDCPVFCPVTCAPEELFCPGHWDENGCQVSPDMCMPSQNDDSHCQLHCPVQCAAD